MADNVTVDNGTGTDYGVASDKVTFSGDADQAVQLFRPVHVTGSEGSKTIVDLTTTDGLLMVAAGFDNAAADAYPNVLAELLYNGGSAPLLTAGMVFNGSTWDRLRGDTSGLRISGGGMSIEGVGGTVNALYAAVTSGTTGDPVDALTTPTDAESNADTFLRVAAAGQVFNGTDWDRMRGTTTGLYVQGHLNHDAVDAGNPIKIGGKANDSAPTQVANADRVDAWLDRRGALFTRLTDSAGAAIATGVQYIEDSAITANLGQGTLVVARRDDALSALTPAENDAVGLRVDANGALWVAVGAALPAGTNAIGKLAANSGVDIGDVDVTSLPALPTGTNNIGDVDVLTVPADPFGANADAVVAAGATGSISAKLRRATQGLEDLKTGIILAAGSANIGDVDVLTLPASTNTIEVVGDVAQDIGVAGNPVLIGARASTAIPTAMSGDGDAVYPWANRNGALIVSTAPHVGLNADPFTLTSKTVQTTTTQTGSDVVTPTSGKKLVVTSMQLQVGGTTAGTVQVWFGANADTTYSRGTDLAIFDGEFAPSATLKPGVIMNGPWIASAADHEIHLTTSAAINPLTVTVWYYEV